MTRLKPVSEIALPPELEPLIITARRLGTPTERAMLTLGNNPEVLRGFLQYWESFFWNGRLEPSLRELVRYFVAQRYACTN